MELITEEFEKLFENYPLYAQENENIELITVDDGHRLLESLHQIGLAAEKLLK